MSVTNLICNRPQKALASLISIFFALMPAAHSAGIADIDLSRTNLGTGIIWSGAPSGNAGTDYYLEYQPPERAKPERIGLIIENEATGRPVATLPIPLGNGLAIGITGTLEYQLFGQTYRWTNNNPHGTGTSSILPNASQGATLVLGNAITVPHKARAPFTAVLNNPTDLQGENLRVSLVCTSKPCRITGTTFVYPPLKLKISGGLRGERTTVRPADFYLTRGGTARISSSCSIEANPNSINFGRIVPGNRPGPLDLSHESTVSIQCRNGSNARVAVAIDVPRLYYDGNRKVAAFRHDDGEKFRGLGLVYSFNRDTLGCSGSTLDWRKRQTLGRLIHGKTAQTIYWGLCQLESAPDTGRFSTPATIRFWVN